MTEQTRPHVLRPDLPWRRQQLTECGRPINDVTKVIDRGELTRMIRIDGIQRTSYGVCMTCLETAQRWPTWAADPVAAMSREVGPSRQNPVVLAELRAIAALVEAHREEFDDYLSGLDQTVSLDRARSDKARRMRFGGHSG
jgi:hypothetical protein